MNGPNVLFFSRDPGATNQLVAVRELLCAKPSTDAPAIRTLRQRLSLSGGACPQAVVVGKRFALAVWRAAGIPAEDWSARVPDDAGENETREALAELLETRKIALVVTGTDDIDEPATVILWQTAQRAGIPVAVFLDNRVNLDPRFRTRNGELVTPDLVFALDRHSADSLAAAGIPQGRIRTTANLHLARLARIAADHAGARETIRESWEAGDAQVVLFASENTTEMAALGRPAPWDEFALLERLIADLAAGRAVGAVDPGRGPVLVVIRPHPRDGAGKYDDYPRAAGPAVRVSAEGTPLEAVLAADLTVGMDSALLFEARALGRPALSLVSGSAFNAAAGET